MSYYPDTPILDGLITECIAIIDHEESMGDFCPIVGDDTYVSKVEWRTDVYRKLLGILGYDGTY